MSQIHCLQCEQPFEGSLDKCPHCGDPVTLFQRSYSDRLIDGKYQILERLGMGGMGEIFKVRHIHLNELRVIKLMRANIASDDQALQRFLHEARTSTMIKHRNLAMLYDFSTLDDGSYYMVWEFIEGTNIQKWIGGHGPIPPRLTVDISIQALDGLDHLHSMGIIHRDVSPENIMLSQDHQGRLLVKVIDFGIAKQLSDGGEKGQGLTQTGMFLGKLKYASPEQAGFMQEGEQLDYRSDLYSFGVVMYEMLAGRAPFLATNPHSYILKHATEKPLPFSQINPNVSVPARLEAEVLRALEKDRSARHQSAAQFADALEAIRDQIPPDEKYGADLKLTISKQASAHESTRKGRSTRSSRTKPSDDPFTASGKAPTLLDEHPAGAGTSSGFSSAPTLVGEGDAVHPDASTIERTAAALRRVPADDSPAAVTMSSSGDSTVMQPEVKAWQTPGPSAEPLITPYKRKSNRLKIGGGIAALLILTIVSILYMRREVPEPPLTTTAITTTTSGTTIEARPPAAGHGEILVVASPYGHVESIVNTETNAQIAVPEGDTSTPMRLELPSGNYRLLVSGPDRLERKSVDVQLDAGARPLTFVAFKSPDLDRLSGEILGP